MTNDWRVEAYPSGTVVVRSASYGSWLDVCGPATGENDDWQRCKYPLAEDLAAFLNGCKERPAWLNDMTRTSEERMADVDGTRIIVRGPLYDRNPPALDWWTRDDQEAKDMRARLMDKLQGVTR